MLNIMSIEKKAFLLKIAFNFNFKKYQETKYNVKIVVNIHVPKCFLNPLKGNVILENCNKHNHEKWAEKLSSTQNIINIKESCEGFFHPTINDFTY